MDLLLGAQVLVLAALVAVSIWGWREIPPEARIRARAGATGTDFTLSKTTALLVSPLVGAMVVAATASSDEGNRDSLGSMGLLLLVFLLLAHRSTLRRAAG